MITSKDFDKVQYKKPRLKQKKKPLSNILGIDSEAYTTGQPFILATSEGRILDPEKTPGCFFPDYSNVNFVVWNLKYDSGAILYHLPRRTLESLWENGIASYFDGESLYRFSYIPHKLLRIRKGIKAVSFWEISQFFRSSLEKASQTYLQEGKQRIATKNFTPQYYEKYKKSIEKYCIQDALLTRKLGEYLIDKLNEFGLSVSSLYSSASISFQYFCKHTSVVTAWRYWQDDKKALGLACDAYEGGKFEITARGRFSGFEYDITSAYPYEIGNLVDISNATVTHTCEYQPKAVYGFLDCIIDNEHGMHLPCGPMPEGVRIYPMGKYRLCITKKEYEYLLEINVPCEIKSAVWFFVKRKKYPYRKAVDNLFEVKTEYKSKDRMIYNITKVCLNGFYGKMAQSVKQPDGSFIVGQGWNPIYASVITANTRLKVTRMQNLMKDKCLAVHTDSVITTEPLPPEVNIDGSLGEFEPVISGTGILILCGLYQINDICAFKGFKARPGETWEKILSRFPYRKSIPYSSIHVESWLEAIAKNHPQDHINRFMRAKKIMSLNADVKRLWFNRASAKDLLNSLEQSAPKIYCEKIPQ